VQSCRLPFHETFEVTQIAAQRSSQHHWFEDCTDFDRQSCRSTGERIEEHDTDAKIIGDCLPRDSPVRNAHDEGDMTVRFSPTDNDGAGEACAVDPVDLPDGTDKAWKLFEV
jgi:hypothetical protein